jgi:hypothetical protein
LRGVLNILWLVWRAGGRGRAGSKCRGEVLLIDLYFIKYFVTLHAHKIKMYFGVPSKKCFYLIVGFFFLFIAYIVLLNKLKYNIIKKEKLISDPIQKVILHQNILIAERRNQVTTIKIIDTNVVISYAHGYNLIDFKIFVGSLRRYFQGTIILFVESALKDDIRKFCQEKRVTLIPTLVDDNFIKSRFQLYAAWCNKFKGICICSDFRDVFFQSDPFLSLPNKKFDLILSVEDTHARIWGEKLQFCKNDGGSNICKCPYNSAWIDQCWGHDGLLTVSDKPIICAGIVIGSSAGFNELAMVMIMYGQNFKCNDQGLLNYLYYSKKFNNLRIIAQSRGEGIVNTVGYVLRVNISNLISSQGDVMNEDGQKSPIIHQYDRFPEIMLHVENLVKKFPICICILTFEGLLTLENTLNSYLTSGLFDAVGEVHILFQRLNTHGRLTMAKNFVKRFPGLLHPLFLTSDLGQRAAFITLARACGQPQVLILEEDFQVSDQANLFEQFQLSSRFLEQYDAFQLRHRKDPGKPNYAHDSFLAGTCCGGKNPGVSHMLEHVTWNDFPEREFPELKVCLLAPKTWCTTSKYGQYTNNPTLYKTPFALQLFLSVPERHQLEPWLTSFWSNQNYTVARSTGIFKHNRIDRTLIE